MTRFTKVHDFRIKQIIISAFSYVFNFKMNFKEWILEILSIYLINSNNGYSYDPNYTKIYVNVSSLLCSSL